ncbi:MAG: YhjD/YihY/BrkB family envelope integrity protein [Desulfobacterales bacterium]|nr:YhjD/YihY/BrkB family envelope integrity protein [Desulfobacterales bacterium]
MSRNIGNFLKYYGRFSRSVLFEAFRSFFRDNCPNLSAAIAFYSILSVIPIVFFILFASGFILGSSESAYTAVVEFIRQIHPYMEDRLLMGIKNLSKTSRVLGWIGFGFLLWISTMLFYSLDVAFTIIFRVNKKDRFFFKSILMASAVIPLGVIAILFSILINIAAVMIEHTELVLFGINISDLIVNVALIRHIIPIFSVIVLFTLIAVQNSLDFQVSGQ